jgi:hypothetical protein
LPDASDVRSDVSSQNSFSPAREIPLTLQRAVVRRSPVISPRRAGGMRELGVWELVVKLAERFGQKPAE